MKPYVESLRRRNTIYLLCGQSGAGKTTYALRLAEEKLAVPLFIDECLRPLIIPPESDVSFALSTLAKAERCRECLFVEAKRILNSGNDVVLDIGTFKRDWRDEVRNFGSLMSCDVELHYVTAPKAIRWQRVDARNATLGPTFSFFVPRWWFELADAHFQEPSTEEHAITIDTNV